MPGRRLIAALLVPLLVVDLLSPAFCPANNHRLAFPQSPSDPFGEQALQAWLVNSSLIPRKLQKHPKTTFGLIESFIGEEGVSRLRTQVKEGATPKKGLMNLKGQLGGGQIDLGRKGWAFRVMDAAHIPFPEGFLLDAFSVDQLREITGIESNGWTQLLERVHEIETESNLSFGDRHNPLLLSVRTSPSQPMPGILPTILNVGLNDDIVKVLSRDTLHWGPKAAYQAYLQLIETFSTAAWDVPDSDFDRMDEDFLHYTHKQQIDELTETEYKMLVATYKRKLAAYGKTFPQDPTQQLKLAFIAAVKSWNSFSARSYRDALKNIPETSHEAIIIQQMVFGHRNDESGTGIIYSRNPDHLTPGLSGRFRFGRQGIELVAGKTYGDRLDVLKQKQPENYERIRRIAVLLERFLQRPVEIEVTIDSGRLYVLQFREAKPSPAAAPYIYRAMADEGILNESQLVTLLDELHKRIKLRKTYEVRPDIQKTSIAHGHYSTAGALRGRLALSIEQSFKYSREGSPVVLALPSLRQQDLGTIFAFPELALLTAHGDQGSHEVVLTRYAGIPAIVGFFQNFHVLQNREGQADALVLSGHQLQEGDWVVVDADHNDVFKTDDTDILLQKDPVKDSSYGINYDSEKTNVRREFINERGQLNDSIQIVYQRAFKANLEAIRSYLAAAEQYKRDLENETLKKQVFLLNLRQHYYHEFLQEIANQLGFSGTSIEEATRTVLNNFHPRLDEENQITLYENTLTFDEDAFNPDEVSQELEKVRALAQALGAQYEQNIMVRTLHRREEWDGVDRGRDGYNIREFRVFQKKEPAEKSTKPAQIGLVPQWAPSKPSGDDSNKYHGSLLDLKDPMKWVGWHQKVIDLFSGPHQADWDSIRSGEVIMDYAVGTGGSAIPLLCYLKSKNIRITLVCLDVNYAWPAKAYELLHAEFDGFHDIQFYSLRHPETREIRKLSEVIRAGSIDRIFSISTLHLVPEKDIPRLIQDFYTILKPGGQVNWASGDLIPHGMPPRNNIVTADNERLEEPSLLHDPFRLMRAWFIALIDRDPREEFVRARANRDRLVAEATYAKALEDANKTFLPIPDTSELLVTSFERASFPPGQIENELINVQHDDWVRFSQVPSLAGYLFEADPKDRNKLVETLLRDYVFSNLRRFPDTPAGQYPTHWVFGKYIKPEIANSTLEAGDDSPAIALRPEGRNWVQHYLTPTQHRAINRALSALRDSSSDDILSSLDPIYMMIAAVINPIARESGLPMEIYIPRMDLLYQKIAEYAKNGNVQFPPGFLLVTHPGTGRDETGTPRSLNLWIPREVLEILTAMVHFDPSAFQQWLEHEILGHWMSRFRDSELRTERVVTLRYPIDLFLEAFNKFNPVVMLPAKRNETSNDVRQPRAHRYPPRPPRFSSEIGGLTLLNHGGILEYLMGGIIKKWGQMNVLYELLGERNRLANRRFADWDHVRTLLSGTILIPFVDGLSHRKTMASTIINSIRSSRAPLMTEDFRNRALARLQNASKEDIRRWLLEVKGHLHEGIFLKDVETVWSMRAGIHDLLELHRIKTNVFDRPKRLAGFLNSLFMDVRAEGAPGRETARAA